MFDIGVGSAIEPVLVVSTLVRLSDRNPHQTGLLRFTPRNVVVHVPTNGLLDHVHVAGSATLHARQDPGVLFLLVAAIADGSADTPLVQERAEQRGVAGHREIPASVLGAEDGAMTRHRWRRMTARLTVERGSQSDPGHQVTLGVLCHGLMDRARQMLPMSCSVTSGERSHHGERELLSGDGVGVTELRCDRRGFVLQRGVGVVAVVHHDTAVGEMHQIGRLEVLVRSVLAEGSESPVDQSRVFGPDIGRTQRQFIEVAERGGVDDHIGAGDQRGVVSSPFGGLDVDDDRLLTPVVGPEVQ